VSFDSAKKHDETRSTLAGAALLIDLSMQRFVGARVSHTHFFSCHRY